MDTPYEGYPPPSADPSPSQGKPGWLRDVVLYLTAQSLSLTGSSIVGFAVVWYVALKTGSGGQYAVLLISSSLAMALTTIPGGVWADRYWRKALIMGADASVAVITLALAVLMLNGFESLWLIAVALALRGLGGGVQAPAVSAALPQLTPADKLMRVNSINQTIAALTQIVAPALAAVLLTFWPLGWILMVDVATAVVAIAVTSLIRIPRLRLDPDAPKPVGLSGFFAHQGEAVRFAWGIPGLRRTLAVLVLLMGVIIPFAAMTPVFVVRLYGPEQWMLAAAEMVWSVGMVVGGLAIAVWGGLRNRMAMIMIATIATAATAMAMGFMPTIWWFLVVMAAQGLSLPMFETPAVTALQENIPEELMGRMMAFVTLVISVSTPIGMAVIGPLSDVLDLSWMAFACGAAGLAYLLVLVARGGPGSKLYPPDVPESDEAAELR